MITGSDPLIIFKFNIPFLGLPFLIIPLTINEKKTGCVENKVDSTISISTETVGNKITQKSYADSLSIEFSVLSTSTFSTMVLPLLKKVFTSASVKDLTFGLISSGFNFNQEYSISYFSGNQYVIDGVMTAFDYGNRDNTNLVDINITISAPPSIATTGGDSPLSLSKADGDLVSNFSETQLPSATDTVNLGSLPTDIPALPDVGSIIPFPGAS